VLDRAITTEYGFQIDLGTCENLMRDGSKSFFAAAKILPTKIRDSAIALYAFCRLLDDMVVIKMLQTMSSSKLNIGWIGFMRKTQ
jgi:phytoene synthase